MKNNYIGNAAIMKQAREALAGKWELAVGTFAVYLLLSIITSSLKGPGALVSLLVSGPFAAGMAVFSLALARNSGAHFEQIFDGFKKFGRAFVAYVLTLVFTILWMLLLIVPGIIAALSYSQAFFIMADDETIGAMDAIKKSKQMMYGYKWELFCLGWRFFGWALLSLLSLGIGFLWVFPYMQVSMAKFHDEIKKSSEPAIV